MALIRYNTAATQRQCMFGVGEQCNRDGEVVSLRIRFQDRLELFGLVLCDKKLSFSHENMHQFGIVRNASV